MRISGPQTPEQQGPKSHRLDAGSSQGRKVVSSDVVVLAQCHTAHEGRAVSNIPDLSTSCKDPRSFSGAWV